MWQLPQLEWQGTVWRMPLGVDTAAELVLALLEEPETCLRKLANLVRTDASLAMWIVCRASKWQDAPPSHAGEFAEWLVHTAIPNGLFQVEPNPDFDRATQHSGLLFRQRGLEVNADWAQAILQDAWVWLVRHGLADTSQAWRDCPWLPRWLDTSIVVADQFPSESVIAMPPGESQQVLARLLPRLLQQIQRVHALETSFSATLEREKIAALRELAYGASHEINNPLANIATRAQSLLREENDPERKRKLATIAAQAFRAHEMIADMMLFAKPPAPTLQQVNAGEVVATVVREISPDAKSQQTELNFPAPSDPLIVTADPTQLAVAVKAILRNALEALVTAGTITVDTRFVADPSSAARWLEISIHDTGPGISPEVRRHLFDPFYSGREAGRGLGFGLAKVWRIAELHHGTIQVESETGQGTRFALRIPE